MPTYKATHIPYGLSDHSKRTISNPGIKDEVIFEEYGIETGGESFSTRVLVKGGGGVPLHRHSGYGEQFFPVQGSVGVVGHNGSKTMNLKAGTEDTYTVVPGEWHRFFNPSETEDMTFDAKVRPAHQGFEKSLHIFYGLAVDGKATPEGIPKSWFHLLMLSDMGDVGYPGIRGMVMGWLTKTAGLIAKITGVEESLTRKYYGHPITQEDKAKWKIA